MTMTMFMTYNYDYNHDYVHACDSDSGMWHVTYVYVLWDILLA